MQSYDDPRRATIVSNRRRSSGALIFVLGAVLVTAAANLEATTEGEGSSPRPTLLAMTGLEPGPHPVGFRSLRIRDIARPWPSDSDPAGSAGRPIQIGLWYPALDGDGEPMRVGDYVLSDWAGGSPAVVSEKTHRAALDAARKKFEVGLDAGLSDEAWARAWSVVGSARFDLAPQPGRRPLLLFAGGLGSRSYSFVPLAEVLASRGYVVAVIATYGHSEHERPGFDLEAVKMQVADMEAALALLREEPEVDGDRVALVGWSFGGVSQAFWRLDQPDRFRAAVSLDSGSGYAYGAELLAAAGVVDASRLTVPFLDLEAGRADVDVPRSDDFWRAHGRAPAERYRLSSLSHGDLVLSHGAGRAAAMGVSFAGLDQVVAHLDRFLGEHLPPYSTERVTLQSGGWQLIGDFVVPDRHSELPAALLLNKAAGNRTAYVKLAEDLARRGVASLRLDLRGHGDSINRGRFVPEEGTAILAGTDSDVATAVRWLRQRPEIDADRIGIVGASYSGEAMMVAAGQTGYAAAYVGLSPGSLSDASIAAIDREELPWLLVVSRHERHLTEVVKALREQSRTAELLELSGTAHATNLLAAHPGLAARLALWLSLELAR